MKLLLILKESLSKGSSMFTDEEKKTIISIFRNPLFDLVRETDLYTKYRGSTIPYDSKIDLDPSKFDLLVQGIKDASLDTGEVLDKLENTLSMYRSTPISTDFDPSTGYFEGFGSEKEKQEAIDHIQKEIDLVKKFIKTL